MFVGDRRGASAVDLLYGAGLPLLECARLRVTATLTSTNGCPDLRVGRRQGCANLRKHGLSFEDAATAFQDPLAQIHPDPDHSAAELREILIGPHYEESQESRP